MIVYQRIVRSSNGRGGWIAGYFLTLAAAILVLATPSFAQAPPENADNVATQNAQATEAQSPLTSLFGVLNENYTNFRMGPLHETQNDLIVEPIIPVKLTGRRGGNPGRLCRIPAALI